jgi:hypothetical protein
MTPEDIKTALTAAKESPIATDWDKGFSESIIQQIDKGRTLSEKQMFHVNKIIENNSGEALKEAEKWEEEYREKYEADAKYLSGYYTRTNYFRSIVNEIIAGNVPHRRAFLKMYGNKYAKTILAERDKPPRFDARTHVVGNSKFRKDKIEHATHQNWRILNDASNRFCEHGGFIVGVAPVVRSAAKGNKVYNILPVGGMTMVMVEERFLKKAKR